MNNATTPPHPHPTTISPLPPQYGHTVDSLSAVYVCRKPQSAEGIFPVTLNALLACGLGLRRRRQFAPQSGVRRGGEAFAPCGLSPGWSHQASTDSVFGSSLSRRPVSLGRGARGCSFRCPSLRVETRYSRDIKNQPKAKLREKKINNKRCDKNSERQRFEEMTEQPPTPQLLFFFFFKTINHL